MFTAAGWQVITLKYGRLLAELFARPGGEALRHRIDAMPNPEYQRLLRCPPDELRRRLPGGDEPLARLIADLDDAALAAAIRNLGGHDLAALDEAFGAIDDSRPTIILAYTIKGYGLAIEGHPQNHSALLTQAQLGELAAQLGADPDRPWNRVRRGQRGRGAVRADRPAAAPAAPAAARPAPGPARPRPHADRGGHHPGGAGPGAARPDQGGARGGPAGGDGEPGRQLEHQPRRLGEQGRRVVGPANGPTGSPTTPRPSCTGGRSRPGSTSSSASPRPTWSACSASSARPGAAGASRCSRSACFTTRSWNARSSRGRSASTRAASRSWSARRPA